MVARKKTRSIQHTFILFSPFSFSGVISSSSFPINLFITLKAWIFFFFQMVLLVPNNQVNCSHLKEKFLGNNYQTSNPVPRITRSYYLSLPYIVS